MEHVSALRNLIRIFSREIDLDLTENQIDEFVLYLSEIIRWNATINITSITDPRAIVIKHFIDSLTALSATEFPFGSHVCDIGSGAGLPGIALRIARPDLNLTLVESNKKKCSFLNSIIGLLMLENVNVFAWSFDKYTNLTTVPSIDIIVIRALRFKEVWKDVVQVLRPNGKIVLYRTDRSDCIEDPGYFEIESERSFSLPEKSGERVITVIKPLSSHE